MIIDNSVSEIETGALNEQSSGFQIEASPKAFQILSKCYANPIRAIIRELLCNAIDANADAGVDINKIDINLPTESDPVFGIKDYGIGMSDSEVHCIYTHYFKSTKSGSNDRIGGLGLGSKTPFAYTSQFTVESKKDGEKNVYAVYKDENGLPAINRVWHGSCGKESGTSVSFAVKSDDLTSFWREYDFVMLSCASVPHVTGGLDAVAAWHSVTAEQYLDSQKFLRAAVRENDVIDDSVRETSGVAVIVSMLFSEQAYAEMGGVLYRIDENQFDASLNFKFINSMFRGVYIVHLPIGAVSIQPNREDLIYNKACKSIISVRIMEINSHFVAKKFGCGSLIYGSRWLAQLVHAYDLSSTVNYYSRAVKLGTTCYDRQAIPEDMFRIAGFRKAFKEAERVLNYIPPAPDTFEVFFISVSIDMHGVSPVKSASNVRAHYISSTMKEAEDTYSRIIPHCLGEILADVNFDYTLIMSSSELYSQLAAIVSAGKSYISTKKLFALFVSLCRGKEYAAQIKKATNVSGMARILVIPDPALRVLESLEPGFTERNVAGRLEDVAITYSIPKPARKVMDTQMYKFFVYAKDSDGSMCFEYMIDTIPDMKAYVNKHRTAYIVMNTSKATIYNEKKLFSDCTLSEAEKESQPYTMSLCSIRDGAMYRTRCIFPDIDRMMGMLHIDNPIQTILIVTGSQARKLNLAGLGAVQYFDWIDNMLSGLAVRFHASVETPFPDGMPYVALYRMADKVKPSSRLYPYIAKRVIPLSLVKDSLNCVRSFSDDFSKTKGMYPSCAGSLPDVSSMDVEKVNSTWYRKFPFLAAMSNTNPSWRFCLDSDYYHSATHSDKETIKKVSEFFSNMLIQIFDSKKINMSFADKVCKVIEEE